MAPVFLMATAPTVDGHAPVEAVGCNWPTPVDHAEALTTMVLRDLSADLVLVQKSWRHGDAAQREAVAVCAAPHSRPRPARGSCAASPRFDTATIVTLTFSSWRSSSRPRCQRYPLPSSKNTEIYNGTVLRKRQCPKEWRPRSAHYRLSLLADDCQQDLPWRLFVLRARSESRKEDLSSIQWMLDLFQIMSHQLIQFGHRQYC